MKNAYVHLILGYGLLSFEIILYSYTEATILHSLDQRRRFGVLEYAPSRIHCGRLMTLQILVGRMATISLIRGGTECDIRQKNRSLVLKFMYHYT